LIERASTSDIGDLTHHGQLVRQRGTQPHQLQTSRTFRQGNELLGFFDTSR
jgi:hypothetical protein